MNSHPLDDAALKKISQLIKGIRIAMLTTAAPDSSLRSRPMATQDEATDGELWFFTADDSGKTDEIAREHHVNLSYAEPKEQRYVSISGIAEVVQDREQARRLWKPQLKEWFPGGLDDPKLALLRVRITAAEYWDSGSSAMVAFFHAAMSGVAGLPAVGETHDKFQLPSSV